MDYANRIEAIREALMDVEEGADMVMVKPGIAYLDIVREVKNAVNVPVTVFHVSGEYAMIKAASERGWLDHAHGDLRWFVRRGVLAFVRRVIQGTRCVQQRLARDQLF